MREREPLSSEGAQREEGGKERRTRLREGAERGGGRQREKEEGKGR